MNTKPTTLRLALRSRLRAAFSAFALGPAQQMSQRMPDLERWSMPHRAVDMRDWEVAYNMALNPIQPDRCRLMDLVDSLLTDAHTASVMESRVLRVVRSKFKLVDAQGAARPDLLPLLETQWFEDFLRYAAEAVFRGHTLIMLDELVKPGQLKTIVRIDPRNVLPHAGVVVRRQGETTGYSYREEPLSAYCIEVGRPDELGILAKVAPVVVVKKYAIGSWSDYVHKYGIPARWVKSRSTDKARIRQLEDLMQNMVSSAYAVLGGDDELQVMQTPGVDAHKVFDELITRMNSEISKRILGQDGTSDNKDASGTYGSLKVLQGVAEDRHQADKSSVSHVIHFDLPGEVESYTHRSGRTGRAGKTGISLSIIGVRDVFKVRSLERQLKVHFAYVRVPDAAEICERQLLTLIGKIKQVEVDHEAIERFMDAVNLDLADLSREELIKRVVSLEFNRFLKQYRNARDLNVDLASKDRKGKTAAPARVEGERRDPIPRPAGTMRSMFINLGTKDGFDKGRMLGYLCGISGLDGSHFGRILLKEAFSFIDIESSVFDQVMGQFKAANYKGRRIRVDEGEGGGNTGARDFKADKKRFNKARRQ